MWIGSMDGDLIIHDLTLDDAGLYICSFTGSKAQTIQLKVIMDMFDKAVYRQKINKPNTR